jgi:hypothetical protein
MRKTQHSLPDTTGFMPRGLQLSPNATHLRSFDTTGFMPRGDSVSAYVDAEKEVELIATIRLKLKHHAA